MKHATDKNRLRLLPLAGTRYGIPARFRKTVSVLLVLVGLIATGFSAGNAWAIDLGSAKQQGLVGETPSGYLKAVGSQNDAVNQLVSRINAKRKAEYTKIASENNIDLRKVEALAGKKAIEKSGKGDYVLIGGSWKKK